jgi:hypothetical protein
LEGMLENHYFDPAWATADTLARPGRHIDPDEVIDVG